MNSREAWQPDGGCSPHRSTSTPNRKSGQWHRLANVVRSSQKTFVPNSPNAHAGVSSILRCRTKLAFSDRTSGNDISGQRSERPRPECNSVERGLSVSAAVALTPSKINAMVYSAEATPSKIRSLASSYNVKQKKMSVQAPYNQKKKSTDNLRTSDKSAPLTNPYSLKFLIAFILVVVSVWLCVCFGVQFHSRYHEVTQYRKLCQYDINLLRKNLRRRVYGQHIVTESIPSALEKLLDTHVQLTQENLLSEENAGGTKMNSGGAMMNSGGAMMNSGGAKKNSGGAKMTVMSLHGWTGVGKTFVTQILVDSLKPENFLQFIVPIHFPHILYDEGYKSRIEHDIITNITSSSLNLIVFDEMDKASMGVLKGIRSVIQFLRGDNSYQNSTVIILFASNTLGRSINTHLFSLLSHGRKRENIALIDFRDLFLQEGNHENYGNIMDPWYKLLSDLDMIDSFIPFLPLDIHHVTQCIRHSLSRTGVELTSDLVNAILAELSLFRPHGSPVQYSHTGCKRVAEKVDLHLDHIS